MPTEAELLRAVLDDPDADAPRLAYAAHCDSLGEPRGELIRLQVTAAQLQRNDRDDLAVGILEADARELLEDHGRAWAAPILQHASECVFVRGFVEHITLPARTFLDRAPALFTLAPIRHLDLVGTRAIAQELFASPHLNGIRSLHLGRFGLEDDDAAALASSPHLRELRWLQLILNHVGMDGVRAMARSARLPRLRYVGFFGNVVDPSEELFVDQGVVVDKGLPEAGRALEEEIGAPVPWLHVNARTSADVPPPRYEGSAFVVR